MKHHRLIQQDPRPEFWAMYTGLNRQILKNLTHLHVLTSAIQQEQMHFIACTVRLGVLTEQMGKIISNIHQRRLKKSRIANKTGPGAEVGTKLTKIRHSHLKMYLFKSIQNGQISFLGVSSSGQEYFSLMTTNIFHILHVVAMQNPLTLTCHFPQLANQVLDFRYYISCRGWTEEK